MRKLFIYKKCIGYADVGTSGTKKRPSKQKKVETFQEWKLIPMSQKDEQVDYKDIIPCSEAQTFVRKYCSSQGCIEDEQC